MTRVEVLQEFVDASRLGRRRIERFDGFLFFRRAVVVDADEWRRGVHAFVGELVARHNLKSKWKVK